MAGNTINGKQVRSATLTAYLKAAAEFVTEAGLPDPRFTTTTQHTIQDKYLPRIGKVLTEQRRWESMANKKDPVTPDMVRWLQSQATTAGSTSLSAAIADWTTLGLSAGFRISEYGQSSTKIKKEWMSTGTNGAAELLPRAFIHTDFTFFDEQWRVLPMYKRHEAHFVRITWRKQKHGDNGRHVPFGTAVDAQLCTVFAAIRIYTRALTLNHIDGLLGVFNQGPIKDKQVEKQLRAAATAVYGYTKEEARNKFTSHSIRGGACVLLHEAGRTATFIKDRLRWKSESFMEYLRDTASLAKQHAISLMF